MSQNDDQSRDETKNISQSLKKSKVKKKEKKERNLQKLWHYYLLHILQMKFDKWFEFEFEFDKWFEVEFEVQFELEVEFDWFEVEDQKEVEYSRVLQTFPNNVGTLKNKKFKRIFNIEELLKV